METAVLPAQDHLAQERYRRESRAMSGMIYPLGGLPRTRRKVKSPSKVLSTTSLHPGTARLSSSQNGYAADSRSGRMSPVDISSGVLRSEPLCSSPPAQSPFVLMKRPVYRLHSTASDAFISRESPDSSNNQQLPLSTVSAVPRQVLRTRSDGEMLQGIRKGAETEKSFEHERRKSYEKGSESSRVFSDRKLLEKKMDRSADKLSERRKNADRKIPEKKTVLPNSHGDKGSNGQSKVGVFTILQRPQTKEAAAENIAKFAGRPIEIVEVHLESTEDLLKQNTQVKDAEKKVLNPLSSKGSLGGEATKIEELKAENDPILKQSTQVKNAEKKVLYPLSSKSSIGGEATKIEEPKVENDPVSAVNIGSIALSPTNQISGVSSMPRTKSAGLPHRGLSDLVGGEGGQILAEGHVGRHVGVGRSSSFREPGSRERGSADQFFSPSSPLKTFCERWAGPAYTNSPPPSTLPFPTFPIQRVKSSLAEVAVQGLHDPKTLTKSSSAPSSPTRVASLFFYGSAMKSPFVDPSSATKDLKKMLNLDVEGAVDGAGPVPKPKDVLRDSATQGLKRILQLG